jgi:hypothetical protein
MTEFISYSSLLIKFIEPLLNGDESDEEFLAKAKIGQIAWNHSVSDENDLPLDSEMKAALKKFITMYPDLKKTMNMLVIRKAMEFGEYKQFIFKVENCQKLMVQ